MDKVYTIMVNQLKESRGGGVELVNDDGYHVSEFEQAIKLFIANGEWDMPFYEVCLYENDRIIAYVTFKDGEMETTLVYVTPRKQRTAVEQALQTIANKFAESDK